jgi:DEAD/DEAH box helicase
VSSIVRLRFDAPRHTRATGKNRPLTTFSGLGLAAPILQALEREGYEAPTLIQAKAIPIVLADGDLLGIAQTGTGKTAAWSVPALGASPSRSAMRMSVVNCGRSIASSGGRSQPRTGAIQRVACPMTPWPIPSRTSATTAAAGAPMAGGDNKSLQVERGVGLHTLPGLARGPGFGSHRPAAGPRRHSPQRGQTGIRTG